MNLGRPFKAGMKMRILVRVASATLELSVDFNRRYATNQIIDVTDPGLSNTGLKSSSR